jgi:hypothetical protein
MSRARWLLVVVLGTCLGAAAVLAAPASFTDVVRNHQDFTAATTSTTTTTTPTTVPSTTTTAPPAPRLKVQTTATDVIFLTSMHVFVKLVNFGTAPAPLASVRIRYWYDDDGPPGVNLVPASSACGTGCTNVTTTTVKVSPPRTGAYQYLEIGFTASAGSLGPGATLGPIDVLVSSTDPWILSNDHSRATSSSYVDNPTVTAYLSGTLVWGTEP